MFCSSCTLTHQLSHMLILKIYTIDIYSILFLTELRCPKLFPLPYMKLNCTGTRRGSECSFTCQDNSVLVGKRNTYCKRNGEDPYAKWAMDFQPFCECEI